MVEISYYKDEFYGELINLLKEADLYDEIWEARDNLKRKIKKDSQSILIAKDGDLLIGCVFIMEDGWNGLLWRLAVKKSYRKKGIGNLLMRKAEEIIKSRGIKESSILVDSSNTQLKDWYKKQMYQGTKDWVFMYKKL